MNVRRSIAHIPVVLATAALSLGLSSCGFDAPTDQIYTPAVGVNDQGGVVKVLNAVVVSGSDGSGTVVAGFANSDQDEADSLTAVTGAGEDQGVQVNVTGDTEIPAAGFLNLAEEGGITVSGEGVTPGAFVTLTFVFERGASTTLDVPVVDADDEPYADVPLS